MAPSQKLRHLPGQENYDFSSQVGHLLRRAYQRHLIIFNSMCIDPQLTAVQFAVMRAIRDNKVCYLTTISRAAAMDLATTRGVAERLKERNLISLTEDKIDQRRTIVRLTRKGQRLADNMIPYSLAISDRTMNGLTTAERVALIHLLTRIGKYTDSDAERTS